MTEVYGLIGMKWMDLGGAGGVLGGNVSPDEVDAPDKGRYRLFDKGIVVFHPSMGTFALWGEIASSYNNAGGAGSGFFPITDVTSLPDGRGSYADVWSVADGSEWSIYRTAETGAQVIIGAIRDKWKALGGGHSALGYPITGEVGVASPPGVPKDSDRRKVQRFEAGVITWHASIGAHEVHGEIAGRFDAVGGAGYGFATTDEQPWNGGSFNDFTRMPDRQDWSIYWSPRTGAQRTYGDIRKAWLNDGRSTGFPTTDEIDAPDLGGGGRQQLFERGTFSWKDGVTTLLPDGTTYPPDRRPQQTFNSVEITATIGTPVDPAIPETAEIAIERITFHGQLAHHVQQKYWNMQHDFKVWPEAIAPWPATVKANASFQLPQPGNWTQTGEDVRTGLQYVRVDAVISWRPVDGPRKSVTISKLASGNDDLYEMDWQPARTYNLQVTVSYKGVTGWVLTITPT